MRLLKWVIRDFKHQMEKSGQSEVSQALQHRFDTKRTSVTEQNREADLRMLRYNSKHALTKARRLGCQQRLDEMES